MKFTEKRRQQYLDEQYYQLDIQHACDISIPSLLQELQNTNNDAEDKHRISEAIAYIKCKNLFLKYTAGESLEVLRGQFTEVILAYEQHTKFAREYERSPIFPPFRFAEIDDYEAAIQLISLCYLLHRRDLLPRLAAMLDGAFAGKDTLYEDLFAYELKGRYEVDEWYHDAPYRDIINCFYRETSEESISDMEKYLTAWYTSMKKASWHDSHLDIREDGGGYFGYWAIEAAAVTYLLELDDSSFRDYIVYPKDLLDYARELDKQAPPAS